MSNLAIGYWLIYILVCIGVILFSITSLFFHKKRRNLFLIICSSLFIISTAIFFSLPTIITKQTNDAIHQLDLYLKSEYPLETWEITHTDPDQLEDKIKLHVRFHNEFHIVYLYIIHENTIAQEGYWGIDGQSTEELNESGVTFQHLK